eukprot:gene28718-47092_t
MGGSIGKLLSGIFGGKREVRMLMVGLDAAGKTTILYKMKLGEIREADRTEAVARGAVARSRADSERAERAAERAAVAAATEGLRRRRVEAERAAAGRLASVATPAAEAEGRAYDVAQREAMGGFVARRDARMQAAAAAAARHAPPPPVAERRLRLGLLPTDTSPAGVARLFVRTPPDASPAPRPPAAAAMAQSGTVAAQLWGAGEVGGRPGTEQHATPRREPTPPGTPGTPGTPGAAPTPITGAAPTPITTGTPGAAPSVAPVYRSPMIDAAAAHDGECQCVCCSRLAALRNADEPPEHGRRRPLLWNGPAGMRYAPAAGHPDHASPARLGDTMRSSAADDGGDPALYNPADPSDRLLGYAGGIAARADHTPPGASPAQQWLTTAWEAGMRARVAGRRQQAGGRPDRMARELGLRRWQEPPAGLPDSWAVCRLADERCPEPQEPPQIAAEDILLGALDERGRWWPATVVSGDGGGLAADVVGDDGDTVRWPAVSDDGGPPRRVGREGAAWVVRDWVGSTDAAPLPAVSVSAVPRPRPASPPLMPPSEPASSDDGDGAQPPLASRAAAGASVLLEERGFGSLCVVWEQWGYR